MIGKNEKQSRVTCYLLPRRLTRFSCDSNTLGRIMRPSFSSDHQLDSSNFHHLPNHQTSTSSFIFISDSCASPISQSDSDSTSLLAGVRPTDFAAHVPDTFLDFLTSNPSSSLQSLSSYPFNFPFITSYQSHFSHNQDVTSTFAMIAETTSIGGASESPLDEDVDMLLKTTKYLRH